MKRLLFLCFILAGVSPWASAQETPISPEFRLNLFQLAGWVSGLPAPLRTNILAHAQEFLNDYKPLLSAPWYQLVLVDRQHQLPSDYAPNDLFDLRREGFDTSRPHEKMRRVILNDLRAMNRAARRDRVRLLFSSCYRSWIYQRDLFQHYVNQDGLAVAEQYSARPGQSQHQLGTAADFGSITPEFADTREGRWMVAHAEDFGFSLSYPKGEERVTGYVWEPWHYRYIGVPACRVQKKWFGDVQQYLLEFNNAHAGELKKSMAH